MSDAVQNLVLTRLRIELYMFAVWRISSRGPATQRHWQQGADFAHERLIGTTADLSMTPENSSPRWPKIGVHSNVDRICSIGKKPCRISHFL